MASTEKKFLKMKKCIVGRPACLPYLSIFPNTDNMITLPQYHVK